MELILVRHGQAAAQGIDAGDASRPLTERGHLQARAVGAVLANTGPQPDYLFSSPRLRARETALGIATAWEGVSSVGGDSASVIEVGWLDFDFRAEEVMKELALLPEAKRVVLVGHEPSFSAFCGWLLGMETGYFEMKKASVAVFELSPPTRRGSVLKMLLPSRILVP